MKQRTFLLCIVPLLLIMCISPLLAQQRPQAISCHLNLDSADTIPIHSETSHAVAVSERTITNLCLVFLLCSDAPLAENTSVMNSIIASANGFLNTHHNPLPGPDYQITSYQIATMPASYTTTDGFVLNLTLAGNSSGSSLLDNVAEWKFDLGDTRLTAVVVPNNAGSNYNPGVALWGIGSNLIGTELAATVLKSSSNTIISLSTLLIPHEIFGHLQGLNFTAVNPTDGAHSPSSCNGVDFVNATSNALQVCSASAAQIALATSNGDVNCMGLVLPLDLLHFEAHLNPNKQVELRWNTANESNLYAFEIEKSTDGYQWASIGTISPQNRHERVNHYQFLDKEVRIDQKNYYRLKSIDNDYSFLLSDIRLVDTRESAAHFTLFPNPATTEFWIQLHMPQNESIVAAMLYDVSGRQIEGVVLSPTKDGFLVKCPNSAGTYFLAISGDTGWVQWERVVVR